MADWTPLVRLLDSGSLQIVGEFRHETPMIRVAFSPDSSLLSCRGEDALAVWDVANRKRLWTTNDTSMSHSDAPFSPDGRSVFCQMRESQAVDVFLGTFEARNGNLIKRTATEVEFASQIVLSKDGNTLVAAD